MGYGESNQGSHNKTSKTEPDLRKDEVVEAAKAVAVGFSKLREGHESTNDDDERKKMKAPEIDDFDHDASGYFRSLPRTPPRGISLSMGSSESNHKKTETEMESKTDKVLKVAKTVGTVAAPAVAGLAFAAWGLSMLVEGSDDDDRKKMKAPGRDGYIYRDVFEENPRGYFRDLRNKK